MSTPEQDLADLGATDDGAVAGPRRRAARISQTDVFRAADELLVMGQRPTIDRVRMRLGRGSPNTINDHLDSWWAKLGARLRDLPGQEFPQLPERVAQTLQQLWNEALESAHEALQATLLERERALLQRESDLQQASVQLAEREQAAHTRAAALEDSLTLAREQLAAANQRAQALENSVRERDSEGARLRTRLEKLEATVAEARTKFEAASASHQTERTRLQERHMSAENHWVREVDRARQHTKELTKEHRREVKELRQRTDALLEERDELRQHLSDARAECKAALAVRGQLEERLRTMTTRSSHQDPPASRPRRGSPRPKRKNASKD
jgi:hypothetical protein